MNPTEVRAWAISQGLEIAAKGRIPKPIQEAYEKAQRSVALDEMIQISEEAGLYDQEKPNPLVKAQRYSEVTLTLSKGDPFRVEGERGHWRFLAFVVNGDKTWVDCVDPNESGRAVAPNRVRPADKGATRATVAPHPEVIRASGVAHARR